MVKGLGAAAEKPQGRSDAISKPSRATHTRAAIKAGIGIADSYGHVAQSGRNRWLLFDGYYPRNVTASCEELEWE